MASQEFAWDVLVPIKQYLDEALTVAVLDLGTGRPVPVFCGQLDQSAADIPVLLLARSGMDDLFNSPLATNYIMMSSFGGSSQHGIYEASRINDAACSVLRDLKRKLIGSKMIHSVGIGADRSRLDSTTTRPYIETELTVLSDVRRYTTT